MRTMMRYALSVILILTVFGGTLCASAAVKDPDEDPSGTAADTSGTAAEASEESAEASGPVGVWKVVGMVNGGETISKEELEEYEKRGSVSYMEIHVDGTVTIMNYGQEINGTWDEDEITVNSIAVPYSVDRDLLTFKNGSDTLMYKRTTIEEIYAILGYKEDVLDESTEYSEKEETILDTDEVSVKVTGYKADLTGFTVFLHCENKTDHKLMLGTDDCFINKYIMSPDWAVSLDAKKDTEEQLVFRISNFEKSGISSVDEIILSMKVIDSDINSILTNKKIVKVYPTGKKPEEVEVPDRVPVEGEVILVDNDDCTFILQGGRENPTTGYIVDCYYENRSDKELTIMWGSSKVNGIKAVTIYAKEVQPETRGYTQAVITASTLEKNEIDKVEEIRSSLEIYEKNEEVLRKILEEEFTYKP